MYGREELLRSLKPYKVVPAPEDPPANWEMGTRDQSLFASITAVMEYLAWLGSRVEPQVRERIGDYAGRSRLLKAALTWIESYEYALSIAMLRGTQGVEGLCTMADLEVYGITDLAQAHSRRPNLHIQYR